MAAIFCCGFECGQIAGGVSQEHWWTPTGTASITTSGPLNGARSLRLNPTTGDAKIQGLVLATSSVWVWRFRWKPTTLPDVDMALASLNGVSSEPGPVFQVSDSTIYAGKANTKDIGATGVSVVAGGTYYIDVRVNVASNPWLIDVQVNGAACSQKSIALTASSSAQLTLGTALGTHTEDALYDDIVVSHTTGDYPFGDGYVNHFIPTADGTHNVAGAADFDFTGGTDITNATTTAYTMIDDVPLEDLADAPTDYISLTAPPNATDYVECIFGPAPGISTPTTGPRAVEVIANVAQAATTTGNMEVRLNDNGTMGTVYTATGVAGIVFGKLVRAHFADPPSAATAWNANNDGSNGDFRDLRVRFGSPAAVDAVPDQYLVSIMVEAEFAAVAATKSPPPQLLRNQRQARRVNRRFAA